MVVDIPPNIAVVFYVTGLVMIVQLYGLLGDVQVTYILGGLTQQPHQPEPNTPK